MIAHRKKKSNKRNERHGAAWGGGRFLLLALILVANLSFAQNLRRIADDGAQTTSAKLSPDLAEMLKGKSGAMRVIVTYKSTPGTTQFSKAQGRGAKLNGSLSLVKAGVFTMSPAGIRALANDSDVAFISPDRPLKSMDDLTDSAVGVSNAWSSGLDGTGIGVAIIDSGVNDNHDDLEDANGVSRVVYHQDFTGTSNSNSNGAKWDLYGHGTHVAGIVGSNGAMSNGRFAGLAPNVNFIDLRVLDKNGSGTDSMVIAAIQRAIQLKSTYNIRVINLSLGRGFTTGYANDPLCQAVESAWRAGIVVVVASGNYGRLNVGGINGYGTVTAPGNDPLVLTVGAMKTMNTASRTDDTIASYSSKGPTQIDHVVKPDIVAPGNTIVSVIDHGSTLEAQFPANKKNGNGSSYGPSRPYFVLSGTSMATPAVSGAVALLLQQNPNMKPDQVKARLMKTAYKTFPTSTISVDATTGQTFTSYYDVFTVGAGYLDIAAALASTDMAPAATASALSPTAVYNSATGTVSIVNGSSVVWGSSVMSGFSVVWGSSTDSNSGKDSANSVVWGCSDLDIDALSVDIDGEE